MFLLGNLLAARIVNAEVPSQICDIAVEDQAVESLAREIQHLILEDSFSQRVDPRKCSRIMITQIQSPRGRLKYCWETFTTPKPNLIQLLPLPKRLYFVYRFLVPLVMCLPIPLRYWLRTLIR